MKNVKGKIALVTGGASGMGKLWAKFLARDGAKLIIWDIQDKVLEKEKEFYKKAGIEAYMYNVDVTDREKVYKTVSEIEQNIGKIDILVNNAGIVIGGKFLETDDEKLAKIIDVNLTSLMWTMKAVIPGMMKDNTGHIVNISSASGLVGVPYMPSYSASKWGVIGLTDSIRLEIKQLGYTGIKFTTFCPSYVDTGMFKGAKAPFLSRTLSPEKAVKIAYKSFRKNKYMVLTPMLIKTVPLLKGFLPYKIFDTINGVLGATNSMKHWKGHQETK